MMCRIPGILLGVLVVASAMAQKPVQHIIVDQCDSYEFSVVEMPGDRYTWHLYTELDWNTVNFATNDGNVGPTPYFENGMYQGSTVRVNFLDPGRYFLRVMVWDEVACTNNLLVFLIDVEESKPEATIEADDYCYGDPAEIKIILTGRGPWDVTYTYGDGTAQVNLNGLTDPVYFAPLPVLEPGTTDFWIMEVTDQCTVNTYTVPQKIGVVIHPTPVNSKIYIKED
ncbi:hypothetical protein SAMN05444274_103507 [Mariniphaga anaerophila]|uniref:PKD domain-containing protein n=2 Tax=Mariniphaga anaerophila TaxID=1484053 RepID=A0A1M4YXE9_9BACT|nr:hypothetical protein SAMN05444274_103507 [Mariniphaga anaerophila]